MNEFIQKIRSWFIPNHAEAVSEVEQHSQYDIPYPNVRIGTRQGRCLPIYINGRVRLTMILPGDSVESVVEMAIDNWFKEEKQRRRESEEIARVQRKLNERAGGR